MGRHNQRNLRSYARVARVMESETSGLRFLRSADAPALEMVAPGCRDQKPEEEEPEWQPVMKSLGSLLIPWATWRLEEVGIGLSEVGKCTDSELYKAGFFLMDRHRLCAACYAMTGRWHNVHQTTMDWMGGLAKPIVDDDPDAVSVMMKPVAPQVTMTQAAAQEAAQVVGELNDAQVAASKALEKVLLGVDEASDVACKLREAKTYVDMTMAACTPRDAGQALLASMAACSAARPQPQRRPVIEATKRVRDFFVWKLQIRVSLNDRNGFIDALTDALGDINADIFSQIMHAHSRHVAALFHRAFFSNAGYEAVRRGGVRAKRRPRQSNSDRFSSS